MHVLGTPPAFILSQDQTLHLIYSSWIVRWLFFLSFLLFSLCLHIVKLQISWRFCLVFKDHFLDALVWALHHNTKSNKQSQENILSFWNIFINILLLDEAFKLSVVLLYTFKIAYQVKQLYQPKNLTFFLHAFLKPLTLLYVARFNQILGDSRYKNNE